MSGGRKKRELGVSCDASVCTRVWHTHSSEMTEAHFSFLSIIDMRADSTLARRRTLKTALSSVSLPYDADDSTRGTGDASHQNSTSNMHGDDTL